jgi:hypothetical protein
MVQEYLGKVEMVAVVHHTAGVAVAVLVGLELTTTQRSGNTQMAARA